MNPPLKFYALSAIYFGLASAVVAQSAPAGSAPAAGPVQDARQEQFEHPMLERHGGSEMAPDGSQAPRIQRRGLQDTRQDGEIRRNLDPGDSDAGADRRRPDRDLHEEKRRRDRRDQDRQGGRAP